MALVSVAIHTAVYDEQHHTTRAPRSFRSGSAQRAVRCGSIEPEGAGTLDEFGRWEAGLERQPTASEMLSLIRKLVEASSPDDKLVQVLRAQARVYELLDPDEPMFRSIEMESVAYYPHT